MSAVRQRPESFFFWRPRMTEEAVDRIPKDSSISSDVVKLRLLRYIVGDCTVWTLLFNQDVVDVGHTSFHTSE